jgi:perosamine synthetase
VEIQMSSAEVDQSDEAAVVQALRSGDLALGRRAERFEELAAGVAGAKHGVAVSSGTAGLHLIVRALGIEPGDEVLVPSFTFAASVNAILYEGATPVFVDIEPDTYNLDPTQITVKGTPATKAVMVVDVFGHPADHDEIARVSTGLEVIDDCCEAIGATYRERPVGSFGAAGCFAFYPNKQITTGEGGMIVTDDDELAATCRSLRNQGRDQMGSWLEHERLGFNYRMDELSAALGVSQIGRLSAFLEKRANVGRMYTERLEDLAWLRTPAVRDDVTMSWFVYVVTLAPDLERGAVVDALASDGIPSRTYFPPMHLAPYIRERLGTREGMLPVTEDVARRTLALPFHNRMTEAQVEQVVGSLARAVSGP